MIAERIYDMLPSTFTKVIGELPGSPVNIISINEYSSDLSTEYFGSKNATISSPVVKIVVRTDTYEAGATLVESIKDQLHRYTDDYFMSILAVGTPIYLGRNEQRSHEFQVTFTTQIKE